MARSRSGGKQGARVERAALQRLGLQGPPGAGGYAAAGLRDRRVRTAELRVVKWVAAVIPQPRTFSDSCTRLAYSKEVNVNYC